MLFHKILKEKRKEMWVWSTKVAVKILDFELTFFIPQCFEDCYGQRKNFQFKDTIY